MFLLQHYLFLQSLGSRSQLLNPLDSAALESIIQFQQLELGLESTVET